MLPAPDGTGYFIQVRPDVRLHMVSTGDPSGNPLIFLHGFPEFWWSWRYQLTFFEPYGYRSIAPDLRGVNYSSTPQTGHDPYTQAEDITLLLRALGYDKATIIGHDYGGFVAYAMALFFPQFVEQLIILGTLHPSRWPRGKQAMRVPAILTRLGYHAFNPLLGVANQALGIGRVMLWLAHHKPAFTYEVRHAHSEAFDRGKETATLYIPHSAAWLRDHMLLKPRVEHRTLVLWSEKDFSAPVPFTRNMERSMPNAQLVTIPRAGHWSQQEQPEFVNQAMLEFLQQSAE